MTKLKKNTHLSLSLYLSIYRKYAKCRTKADAHDKMFFQYISISVDIVQSHARIQRGDRGSGPPPPPPPNLKNHKKHRISLLYWTGSPEILKNYLASIQRWVIISTPVKRHLKGFRWRADDGPLFVIFGSSLKGRKKRCQSSDPDQIRMEFRKECFFKLNIWACHRKDAKRQYCRISDFVVQKPMRTRSISKYHFQHPTDT